MLAHIFLATASQISIESFTTIGFRLVTMIHITDTEPKEYSQTANISHIKSQNLNVSSLILQLCLPNPLKPGVKLRMKM